MTDKKRIKNMKATKYISLALIAFGVFMACKKDDKSFPDPYAGGRKPLGVKLSTDPPTPGEGAPGTVIRFKATGLIPHKDSISFNFNSEAGEIVAVDSTGIQVKVPATASTGVSSITIGDQIFFGPVFSVKGKLEVDPNFKVVTGSNNTISDVYQYPDGRLLFTGYFSDFDRKGVVKPLNRIVLTSRDGEVDRTLLSGKGADGGLSSVAVLPNGKLVIAGGFSSYDIHQAEMRNITVLNNNGSLDTTTVNTFTKKDTVPAFNGGTDGGISKVFVHNNMITAIGGFNYYLQYVYDKSDYLAERDSLITDSTMVRQLIRFHPNGALDSTFNYDLTRHRSFEGANGPIYDAFMQEDGKLIIVGRFTRYNGQDAPFIARLNTDGSLDPGFGGQGADNGIVSIRYNPVTQKYMLAGNFRKFNGQAYNGLVMLNRDGTVDPTFQPLPMGNNDTYFHAQQLNNGFIIVNGFFRNYGAVHRTGFMVLKPDGTLATGYNNVGDFDGQLTRVFETKNSSGQTQALLLGRFYRFNEKDAGNIIRLLLKE
jgi:uncharacterized delta-60 repeat protein